MYQVFSTILLVLVVVVQGGPTPYQRALALVANMTQSEKLGMYFSPTPHFLHPTLTLTPKPVFPHFFLLSIIDIVHGHSFLPPLTYAGNIPENTRLSIPFLHDFFLFFSRKSRQENLKCSLKWTCYFHAPKYYCTYFFNICSPIITLFHAREAFKTVRNHWMM